MFVLAARLVEAVFWLCQMILPSNIILRRMRQPDAVAWAPRASLAGTAVYYGLFQLADHGYYDWGWGDWALYAGIPVVISLLKFAAFTPISLIRFAAHTRQQQALKRQRLGAAR